LSPTSEAVLADPALSTRYRVVETIAPGPEDALYLARRLDTGALVDLRVLAGGLGGDRVLVAALVQHATLLARVAAQCPGIAAFHECERTAGGLVVSMAHPEGSTLREVIKREGTLGLHHAVRLAAGLARALERVHRLGLVHGGLRPDNVVLMGPDEDVTLTHFGLDWVLLSRRPGAGSRQHAPQGDLAYRAPEQAWDQATPRSDVYAVGAILYEMLAGAPPPAPLPSQPRVPAEPLRNCRADVSPELERIVTQALQVAPERRPAELAELLESLMAEQDPDRQAEPPRDRGTSDATRAGTARWLAWSGLAVAAVTAIWFAHARVTSAVRPRPLSPAVPAAVAPGPPVKVPASPIEQALAPPAPPDAPGVGIAERPPDARPAARVTAASPAVAGPPRRAERPPGTDDAAKRQIASSPPPAAPAPAQAAEPPGSTAPTATRPDDVAATTAPGVLTATGKPDTGENDPGAIIDWLLSESASKER
jgi:serine/threonine protein kinase